MQSAFKIISYYYNNDVLNGFTVGIFSLNTFTCFFVVPLRGENHMQTVQISSHLIAAETLHL